LAPQEYKPASPAANKFVSDYDQGLTLGLWRKYGKQISCALLANKRQHCHDVPFAEQI
jgi:hypothetical protein